MPKINLIDAKPYRGQDKELALIIDDLRRNISLLAEANYNLEGQMGNNVSIISPIRSGAVAISWEDQHSDSYDIKFYQVSQTTTISSAVAVGDRTADVTATTGFADLAPIVISDPATGNFMQARQVGAIATNTITIDRPFDRAFPSGATITNGIVNMRVDGSSTAQSFKIGPVLKGSIDIARIMGYIEDASPTALNNTQFGALASLTRGILLRRYDASKQVFYNIWNAKNHADISLLSYDGTYTDAPPSGSKSYRFRNSYNGLDKHGVVLRLDVGDYLELLVQDDLTGLLRFEMMAQGHKVI